MRLDGLTNPEIRRQRNRWGCLYPLDRLHEQKALANVPQSLQKCHKAWLPPEAGGEQSLIYANALQPAAPQEEESPLASPQT